MDPDKLKQKLGECRRTGRFNLSYMELTDIPSGLIQQVKATAPAVQELDLRSNSLTSLPADIAELRTLRTIKLNYNRFSTFPAVLTQLPRLQTLEISGNLLTSVEPAVARLAALRELDLSGNQISKIDPSIENLQSLLNLNLENNMLSEVPEELFNLANLSRLDMSTNRLLSLPSSIRQLQSLTRLDLNSNNLVTLPAGIGRLKALRELDVRYNDLKEPMKSMSEESFLKFMDFFRDEEERQRLEEIERLKPVGVPVEQYYEFIVKAEENSAENRCLIRQGHTVCQCGDITVVFGGTQVFEGRKVDDVYRIDHSRMLWGKVTTTGEGPSPRDGHSATFDSKRGRVYVFGGRDSERRRLNDMYHLDVATWKWTKVASAGNEPSPRDGASMCFGDDKIFVFGGARSKGVRFNDLYIFSLETMEWSMTSPAGNSPSPRTNAALCYDETNKRLFIHGGQSTYVLGDVFMLDLKGMIYRDISEPGAEPPRLHSHVSSMLDGNLYLLFGLDEMDGACPHGYCFVIETQQLGDGVSQRVVGRWEALETHLSFNSTRLAAIDKETLTITVLQEGGAAASSGISDLDLGVEQRFYNVLRVAPLSDFAVKPQAEIRRENAKVLRMQLCMRTMSKHLPPSYSSLSNKEEKVMEHVENYRKQFIELYPPRRPLPLCLPNELGVKKFVCTTTRPTLMPYTELYDWDSAARFLSDYLEYEELEDFKQYPAYLPSPYSVLQGQRGDCFDFSNALVSMLIGSGYDAYVVAGYATKAVAINDLSNVECPFLSSEEQSVEQKQTGVKGRRVEQKKNKYKLPVQLSLDSVYQEGEEKKKRAEELAEENSAKDVAGESDDIREEIEMRLHSWVLVLSGKREISETFFIEPTTGVKYTIGKDDPYFGIEVVWNNQNFYVNMQDDYTCPADISEGPGLKGMNFDLKDSACWEYVLEEPIIEESDDIEESKEAQEGGAGGASVPPTPGNVTSEGGGAANPKEGDAAKAAGDGAAEADSAVPVVEDVFDMPPSWVPQLHITREAFDRRCPRGQKLTVYRNSTYEIFATFGECSRYSGEVSRLCLYEDANRDKLVECRECFQRRKDKLLERRVLPAKQMSVETFGPGSSFGLKDITLIKLKSQVMNFYPSGRLDGLISRTELFGSKMVEVFENRDDRLFYRSVTYETPEERVEEEEAAALLDSVQSKKPATLKIVKISEKYERNPNEDADKDIAKRTYYIAQDQISLRFHYGDGRITASSRLYSKDGLIDITQVDPNQERPKDQVLLEEYQNLLVLEKECVQAVREAEREVREILSVRAQEEQSPQLDAPYYDVVRATVESSDEEEQEETQKVEHDYLSPFLPPSGVQVGSKLSREEALEVRERCLRALKDRLIERANIIQARHDEETASLAKRQTNFQRDRDQMTRAEEEEYERACEESMFRIHILEQRLKRHEEQALQKYYDLDSRLINDGRLLVLVQ